MIGCTSGSRIVIACAIVCAASAAQAQTTSAAATVQFDKGRTLFKAGKYAEACAAFEHSQKLDPASGTLYNLAGCYVKLGKLASAWVAYRELAQRDTNTARRADAGRKARELEPRLPRLLIKTTASPPDLAVTMNGQDVTALIGVENPVDLGSYRITAKAPKYKDHETSVEVVAEARTVTVTLELERAPVVAPPPAVVTDDAPVTRPASTDDAPSDDAPSPPPRSRRRTYAVIAGGSGLALVATGMVFGSLARSKWSDVKALCGDDLVCEIDQGDEGRRLSDAAHRNASIATGLAIGGAVAIGVGAYLWLSAPSPGDRTALRVVPTAGAASVGLTLQGGF
jgi:tetratricopeptide (TPR) repeat protein